MRSKRLCHLLLAATLVAGVPRPSSAEFFEAGTGDIDILITCLIREFQAGGNWKACIDPDLARARMTLTISDDLAANPPQDFTYVDTQDDAFAVVKSANGIAGNPTPDGNGATGIEALFVDQGLPARGANIAHAIFRTRVPLPPEITQLPTDRVTVTEEYKILLDDYASAVRNVSLARDNDTQQSPIGLYRFNVGIDEVVRNVGTQGVGFDGFFTLGPLIEGESLVPGPDDTVDGPPTGFEDRNLALNIGLPDAFVQVPHPNVQPFDPFSIRNFTLSGWINPRGSIERQNVALFPDSEVNRSISIDHDQEMLQLRVFDEQAGALAAVARIDIQPDQWSHFAAVLDDESEQIQLYVNGEPAGEPAMLSDFELQDFELLLSNFFIGAPRADVSEFFIDELAIWDIALSDEAIKSHYEAAFTTVVRGDYDGNGILDAADLDAQTNAMKQRPTPDLLRVFDENGDGVIDFVDRLTWIRDVRGTWVGDSNLDGEFNSADMVVVFTAGKYETGRMATWSEGDWTGDMQFVSADLVAAFADGGFERGPLGGAVAVPEPSAWFIFVLGALCCMTRFRRSPGAL